MVTDTHRPAVFETPHRPLTDQLAIGVADAVGIKVLCSLSVGKLQLGRPTSRRLRRRLRERRRFSSASRL
jgi:hypothetical protein